jgi:hypothetical protein
MNTTQLARICYEVDRAYTEAVLNNRHVTPWGSTPQASVRDTSVSRVEALLDGKTEDPAAAHEAWKAAQEKDGWRHGSPFDATAKVDPRLVAYADLPVEELGHDAIWPALVEIFRPFVPKEAPAKPAKAHGHVHKH